MLKLAVLASHQGTNFQAVADACRQGTLNAEIVLLISNNSKAPVVARAATADIAFQHLSNKTHPEPDDLDIAMTTALETAQTDLVVLAGYMKRLGPRMLARYEGRIINVHPSLLPAHGGKGMYGGRVHAAVLAAGDTRSGATVHYVSGDYDTGAIISQAEVAVEPGDTIDTLAARVRGVEHDLMIRTINQLEGELT